MPWTWLTTFMDRPHAWFIFVFATQSCIGQNVGKYLLSERTNFWRKGKREFQALKTKDPAPWCTEQQDRDEFVPGHTGEVKKGLFQRSTEAKLHKVKWSQPPPVYGEWSLAAPTRAKSGSHFKQISHAASGHKQPSRLQSWGEELIYPALEKLDLGSREAILNFYQACLLSSSLLKMLVTSTAAFLITYTPQPTKDSLRRSAICQILLLNKNTRTVHARKIQSWP